MVFSKHVINENCWGVLSHDALVEEGDKETPISPKLRSQTTKFGLIKSFNL